METEFPTKNDLVILSRARRFPLLLWLAALGLQFIAAFVTGISLEDPIHGMSWPTIALLTVHDVASYLIVPCLIWSVWLLARQLEKSADAGKHLREVIDGD